jgi:hypothetical protein
MRSNRDPVTGLVDFIKDIKPYHTKILDVLVEYVNQDAINVTMSENIEFVIDFLVDNHSVINNETGWDTYPYGLLTDGTDPYVIEGDDASGYETYDPANGVVTNWGTLPTTISEAGDTTVFVTFGETFTFDQGNDLTFADTLAIHIEDDQSPQTWDSVLFAEQIVDVDSLMSQIVVVGDHTNDLGLGGSMLAIHGSATNDGTKTVVGSTYDMGTNRTTITLLGGLNSPTLDSNGNVIGGRVMDATSPNYNPDVGYITPFPYTANATGPHGWGNDSFDLHRLRKVDITAPTTLFFSVNATTNVLTATGPVTFSPTQPIYLAANGSLPTVDAPFANTSVQLNEYQPYYVVNVSGNDFQLAFEPNGTPMDIIDPGSGTHDTGSASNPLHAIGEGTDIAFIDIDMQLATEAVNATMSDLLSSSDELIFESNLIQVVDVNLTNPASLVVEGDLTPLNLQGLEVVVQNGGTNNGEWLIQNVIYHADVDRTELVVVGGTPVDVIPLGEIILPKAQTNEPRAVTTFAEQLLFHVSTLELTDVIGVTIEDEGGFDQFGFDSAGFDTGEFG